MFKLRLSKVIGRKYQKVYEVLSIKGPKTYPTQLFPGPPNAEVVVNNGLTKLLVESGPYTGTVYVGDTIDQEHLDALIEGLKLVERRISEIESTLKDIKQTWHGEVEVIV